MDTKKLRQKILDLAIRGKLVPQDPNDEPASVLLERIRAEKEQLIKEGKIKRSKKSVASDTSHYENVPFEVPESWCWTTLGEIGNWQAGATPSRMRKDYYGGNIPWLKTGDLTDGYIYEIPETITDKALEETSVKLNPTGSVLIAMYGATIGKIGILTFPATTNQACCACVDYKAVTPKYLFNFLLSHKEEFVKMGGGGAQPNISKEKIISTLIPIPPIAEQNRIADEIERLITYIEAIELNQGRLEQSLKLCKERILDMALSGKLIPQDQDDEPAIELLRKINPSFTPADNRHYENIELSIPETWCWATVGDLFNHNTGKALNSSNHSGIMMDYITTSNLYWDRFDLSTVKQMPFTEKDLEKCTVTKGDLLICEGGDVGRSAIWNYNYDIRIQNHIHRLRGKANICVRYFFYVFMLYKQRNYIGGKGVAIQGLSSRDLNRLVIPLPPLNEQYRIAKSVDNLFSTIDNILLEL